MKYNFDEVIDRKGTNNVKHDLALSKFGVEDIIPMWVADMDFKTPFFITEAIQKRCKHEFYGYTFAYNEYYNTVINWLQRHYNIKATTQNLHFIPGIVAGIAFCIQAFTNKNDNILILTPIYPPFINLPLQNSRNIICSELIFRDSTFNIDFDDLEKKAKNSKMLILSNPHNPGGRVWTQEELNKISDICYRNKIIVISDEIHADLTYTTCKHHSFSSISDKAKEISITFIAPSKSFNIAGFGSSVAYIFNSEIRDKYFNYINSNEIANGNIFAYLTCEAAFKYGEEWLLQLIKYLENNVKYLEEFFAKHLKPLKYVKPQSSYLVWIDFRELGMTHQELCNFLAQKAKIGLSSGTEFGNNFEGFMRMNIGCPLSILQKALENLKYQLRGR